MSLQKATELKEENITATKLKKKADSKAKPTVKARKQDSSMVNADKVVKTKRTSRKESAQATTPAVDPTSQAIQGDLLANLTGDDLLLANTQTSKATKSTSLSAKRDSSKDTHKDETTKVPSPIAVAASASASASISAGAKAKAKANAKEKAQANTRANANANANANASAEAEIKSEAKSEAAAMVGAEAVGVKAQQRKSKNTKAAPEAKVKASASHKKDEINEESLLDKDLAQSNAKEVVKTKRPASKSSKDRQQAMNKQDVGLAPTAVAQTAVPMTASNSTDISDASSVPTSAASSAVGSAGAYADADAAADNGKSKGEGLDKGKAGMAAVGGQSVLDELGMGRLQDALHLQEDQEHAKESKAHTLPKSRKRVIGEIVSRKDSNEVPVNAQIGLIVNRVNSYSSKEFHVNLQISKQLPWLERSLNMVTFSPEQRAIVTSEERFLVVDSVVGAKSVALVVERAVYLYTKLKQQEKHKRVKVLICHGLSSLEVSYLQALQEHMAVLELRDFVICDLNNLPCNPKEFDIVLIDDAQVMLQWKLYALTTNYQFAYCTIFVDGSKLEAFALRRCQQPYEDILAQGYLPIYSDLELQVLSYAKARANYPFYQYQLAHKKAAKSLKQIGQEYLAPDSTVMIDEALGYLECFYPKAQIDEIINNLYYVLEQKNIASQEKGKDQRPALAGDLNSLEQVKQWLDPKSQERILQESYERSVNWGMYPLGVWHERYHGQGHTLFSSNLDSGLKALSLVYPQQWRLESLNLQFNYLSSQFALDKGTLSGIIPLLSSPSPSLSSNSSPMDEAPLAYEHFAYEQQYLQSPVSVQDIDAPMGNDKGYGDDTGLNHGSYAVQDIGSTTNNTGDDSTTVLGKRGPRPFSYVELLLKMGFKRREVDNYNFDQGELFDLPKLCALSLQMDIPVFKSFALGYGSMQVYLNRRFGFELNKHEANGYRSFKANRIFSSFVQKFEDLWLTEYEKLKLEREMRAQSLMSLRLLSLNYQTSPLVLSSCYKFTSLWTKQHDISSRLAPNHEESQFQVIDQNLRIDMLCYAQALKNQAQSQQTSPINNAINSSSKVDSAVNSQDIYQDAITQALSFNALSSFDSYKLQALCLLSMGKISTHSLSQIFSHTLKACNSASQASSDASTAVPGATVDPASTASTVSAAQMGASTVKSDDITATGTGSGTSNVSGAGADADAITGTDSNKLLATLEQQLMSYFLQRGISLGELSTLLTWEQLHQTVLAQQVILGQSLHWEPQLGTPKLIKGNSLEQVDKLLNLVPVPERTASKAQVATVVKTGAIAGASASAGDSFGSSFVSGVCAQLKLNSPELLKRVECALAELMACRLGKVWHSAHYVQLQPSVLTRPQDSDLARGSLSLIQYAPALQQVLSQEPSFKLDANVTTSATRTCDVASQLVSEVNREFSASQIELNNLDCSFSMVAGYYAYQALDAFDENMQQHYSFAANYGHIFNSAVIHKIKGQNVTHKLSDHDVTKETYQAEQNLVLGGSWLEQQPNTNGSTNASNASMATALDLASATAMPMALVSARDSAVALASDSSSDAAVAEAAADAVAAGAEAALKYFLHTYGCQWGYELGAYEQDWHLSAKDINQLSNQEHYLLSLSSYVLNQDQGLKGQSKDASAKVDIYPFALKGASDALIKQFKLVQSDYDFAPWYYASWQVVEDWGQRLASNQVLYEIVNSKPGYHFGHFSDQIRANLGHDKLEKLCFALDGAAYELGFTNSIEPQAYGYNYFLAPFINDWVERGYSLEQLQDLVSNALLSNSSWQNHDVSALRATYSHQGDINYKYQLSLACSHYEVNLWANHQPLAAFNYQKELSDNKEVLSKALASNIVCTVPAQIKEKLPDHDLITYVRPYHVGKDNVHSALHSCGMKRLAISTGLGPVPGPLPSPSPSPSVSLNMGQLSGHKASSTKARVSLSYPVKVKTKQVVRAKRVELQLQPELASDSLLDNGFAQDFDSSLFPNSVQHSDSSTTVMPSLPPFPSALSGDTSIGDVPQLNEAQDGDDWDFDFEQADSTNTASKVTSKQSLDDEFNAIINLSAQQSNNLDNAALVEQAFEFDQDLEQELDQDQNYLEQTNAATQSLAPAPSSHLTSLEVPDQVQTQEFDGEAYQANKLASQLSTALKPHQEPTQGALSLEDAQAQADGQPHSQGHAQGQDQDQDQDQDQGQAQGQGYGHGQEQAPIDGVSSFDFMEGDYADDDMDGVAFDKEKAITEARAKAQQSVLSKDKVDVNNISLEDAAQSNNLFAMPSGYDLSSVLFDDEFFENEVQPPKPTINQLAKRYWRNCKLNALLGQTHNGQDNHNGQVTSYPQQSSAHGVAPCSGPAAELGSDTGAWGASTENSHDHSMGTGQLFNGQVKAKVATRDDSKGCASASSSARAGVASAGADETFMASSVGTDTTTRAAMGEVRELKDNSIDYVHAYELNNDLGNFVYSKSTSKASLKAKDSALYEGDIRTLSTNQALQLELDAKGLEHDQGASSNGAKIFTHELAFEEANNNLESQAHKQERLKEVYSKQNEALQLLCAIAPHGMGSIDVVKVSSYNNYIEGMGAYLQHIESFIPNLDQRYNIFRLKDYSQDKYTATKAVLKKDCPSNLIMSSRNHILSWTDFILRHLSDPIKTSCATSSLESLVWRALNAQFKRQATFSFIERNYYELMKAVKYSHAQTNYRAVINYCQEQIFSPLEHSAINFITNLLLVVAKSDSADISKVQQSTSSNHKCRKTVYGYERYFSQESAQHSLQTKLNSEQAELNLRKLHLTPEQQAQLSSFQAPQAQKKLHCALPSGHTLAQDSASDGAKRHLNTSADSLAGTRASTSANINTGASANAVASVSASVSAKAGASARASAGGELVKGDSDRANKDATTALAGEQSWDGAGKGQLEGRAEHGFGCGCAYELDCDKLERLLPKEQQRYLILKVLQVSAYLNKAHQRLQVGLFDYQKVLTIQDRVVIAALSDDFVVEVLKLLQDLMVEQSPLLELSSSYELIALVADITHCCTVESLSNLKIQANKNNELNSVNADRVHNKSYLGVNQVAALTKGCQELIAFLEQQELEEVILLERYYAKMRLYAPSAHERVLKLLSAAYLVHFNRDFEVLLNNLLAAFVSPNIGLESEQSSYDWDTEELLDQDSASNSDIWADAIDDSSSNDLCEPDEQDETGEQSDESEEGFLFDDNFEEGQKVTDKLLRRLKDPCDYHAQWQDLQEYDFKERAFSKDLKAIMEFIISKIEPQMAYSYSNNMISYFNRTRFKLQQDELNLASILAFRGSMCDRMALLVPPSETLSPSELLDALGCARNEIKVINGDDKLTATLAHSSLQALQLRNELIRRLCKPQA